MGATAIEQALNAILLLVTFIIIYKKNTHLAILQMSEYLNKARKIKISNHKYHPIHKESYTCLTSGKSQYLHKKLLHNYNKNGNKDPVREKME
jgi:hypothetical protein